MLTWKKQSHHFWAFGRGNSQGQCYETLKRTKCSESLMISWQDWRLSAKILMESIQISSFYGDDDRHCKWNSSHYLPRGEGLTKQVSNKKKLVKISLMRLQFENLLRDVGQWFRNPPQLLWLIHFQGKFQWLLLGEQFWGRANVCLHSDGKIPRSFCLSRFRDLGHLHPLFDYATEIEFLQAQSTIEHLQLFEEQHRPSKTWRNPAQRHNSFKRWNLRIEKIQKIQQAAQWCDSICVANLIKTSGIWSSNLYLNCFWNLRGCSPTSLKHFRMVETYFESQFPKDGIESKAELL